jgi:hypothetical protein
MLIVLNTYKRDTEMLPQPLPNPRHIYGKVAKFRSLQTKHTLMCKTHEQDKVSVLKHVLCGLMNVPVFFHKQMFNMIIIKKLEDSLQLIENIPL